MYMAFFAKTLSSADKKVGDAARDPAQLHVIMLTNAVAPDKLGGLERYVRELSAELVRQGHAATIITKRIDDRLPVAETCPDGVRVLRYAVPAKSDPLYAVTYPIYVMAGVRKSLATAAACHPQLRTIVHGHFPLPMAYVWLRRWPYLYTCHAPVYKEILDERQDSYRLPRVVRGMFVGSAKTFERIMIGSAARVVTLSRFVANEVCELTGKAPEGIIRIPGGLDTGWFCPSATPDPQRTDPGPLIFSARRLVSRTGVGELVGAMPEILEQVPTARLAVAGDGPLLRQLQKEALDLGLADQVQFLGRISDVELRRWYRRADIAVTPTRKLEGFGLSTVEAMACGTVPLVTPVAANPEVVGKISPLLVAPGADAHAIAQGVLRLWDAPSYGDVKSSVRATVHPQLGWPEVGRQYVDLYRRTVVGPGTPRRYTASPAPVRS